MMDDNIIDDKIDWKLLEQQRETMIVLRESVAQEHQEHLDGIINLLDYLQDTFEPKPKEKT